jgi:hypothetical protein
VGQRFFAGNEACLGRRRRRRRRRRSRHTGMVNVMDFQQLDLTGYSVTTGDYTKIIRKATIIYQLMHFFSVLIFTYEYQMKYENKIKLRYKNELNIHSVQWMIK